ncbi:MAG: hypothetical protein ABSF77_01880 [Spirochaetia bacterium]|jgi:hypothetical protein
MSDLEKRISGDWIELREKANDLYTLLDALAIPSYELRAAANTLRFSVEQGIVEFKRTLLSRVLVTLETARYKSLAAEEMSAQEKSLAILLLAILLQRLLCAELLPLARPQEEKRVFGVEGLQVGAILNDVNARVKTNPALRSHLAIKNIFMQVQRYNGENQKMRELLPTIKPEMRTAFLANFTRTFDEIIGSIRRHYAALLQAEMTAETARKEGFSLALMPLKEIAPLLASQAKEIAQIRSTLAHARDEKYKTREALVRLYDGRQVVLKLLEDEVKAYRRICQRSQADNLDFCALSMAAGFRDEIVSILEKQGKKEEPAEKSRS